MKKNYKLLFSAFLFYLVGHVLWTFTIICDEPILLNDDFEQWMVNIPFFIFTIIGLIATYRLYKNI
jgi:hypothetical protein|tara:strand:+ start:837 stop:1034 length:198 start_codon:yes stop_codon:yes gene_type:complete